jgi:uncharacterized protein involved in exopolysaccharide biosynthesis
LPQEANSLLGQLTGLREQQKALITEIGRLQDRRSTLANQLSLLQKERIDAIEDTAQNVTDPKTTLAWSELVKRKADMQAELQHLLTEYTEKHPDVLAKKSQIESIQQDMDKQLAEWKERIAEKEKKLRARTNMPAEAVTLEMRNVDNEIKRQQVSLSETDKNIGAITDRINKIPGADVALGAIEREYQTKKSAYDCVAAAEFGHRSYRPGEPAFDAGGAEAFDARGTRHRGRSRTRVVARGNI